MVLRFRKKCDKLRKVCGKEVFCGMRRITALFLAVLALFCACSKKKTPDTYAIGAELMALLWDVDYRDFSSRPMTEFAKRYYEASFLEYYLEDPDYNAGVEHAVQTALVTRLLSREDQGTATETLDGIEYIVQKIRVEAAVDAFAPEFPEENYFAAGEEYALIYQLYFVKEAGAWKLSGFSFLPEDGQMLPSAERQTLDAAQKAELLQKARQYLAVRYEVAQGNFSAEEAWAFYAENADAAFLAQDRINLESLQSLEAEYAAYGVQIRLREASLEAGDGKTLVDTGAGAEYCFWVEANYTYEIRAQDAAFLAQHDLDTQKSMREMLYFRMQEDGSFRLCLAEYLEE